MADEETKPAPEPKADKAVAPASGGGQVAAAATAGPAVIVVPQKPAGLSAPEVSRRRVLQIAFWTGLMTMLGGVAYTFVNNFYPRGVTGFGAKIFVGTVDQLQPGTFIRNLDAKAWVMRMGPEQAAREGAPEGSILALYHKCPHLGCTVPYREEFNFADPRNSDESYSGWFRCPCHGSTYSFAGVRVFGPAPRSMDTFALEIVDGNITVDTGTIIRGTSENPSRAILPS
jgi:cytochrome b6-f complex iron-sulfur subunit